MGRLVVIDGVSHTPDTAKISVYDRGFLYGDSVFETIRTYAGKLFALDEHMRRLRDSAAKVGIKLPLSEQQLADETRRSVLEAKNLESCARVMLTRGSGPLGLDTALAERACRVIIVEPLTMPPPEHYRDGIGVLCVQTIRASDAAHSAKLGNYLASALALREARDAGAVEALVVNRDGLVVEGTTSNVFAVKAGALITPPIEIGILAGITRSHIIGIAEEHGLDVQYRAYQPADLAACDEVFITSSIREVLPIIEVDGVLVGNGNPGEITRKLHGAYRRLVGLPDSSPLP